MSFSLYNIHNLVYIFSTDFLCLGFNHYTKKRLCS